HPARLAEAGIGQHREKRARFRSGRHGLVPFKQKAWPHAKGAKDFKSIYFAIFATFAWGSLLHSSVQFAPCNASFTQETELIPPPISGFVRRDFGHQTR